MLKKSLILAMACFATMAFAQTNKMAVLNFKASVGISQQDVDGISAIFITYFSPQGWTLVERTQIDKIISEQGFQKSSMTESQMVKVGKILNLKKIVIGDVNIISGSYNLDVRIVDVESGTISAKDGETWTSGISYRSLMQKLATRLSNKIAITQNVNPTSTLKPVVAPTSSATSVITLYGYLKIYPKNLGVFTSEPATVISNINKNGDYNYNTWRIPTKEEWELILSNASQISGISTDQPYMTVSNRFDGKEKVVRLVTSDEKTVADKEKERQAAEIANRLSVRDFVETAVGLNMKMVYVEGGSFLMGATSEQGSDGEDDEKAIRRVSLDSYYIGECEVTQSQWSKVMGTSVSQQAGKAGYSADRGVGPDYPMYYVSWEEAQAFCRELSLLTGRTYCLPTEAQWEYAARGGKNNDGTMYSGSWSLDAVAWYGSNSGGSTHPVKTKRPNSLGLYDMSGNVCEWCSDWYGSSYNVNETSNPVGPSSGSYRVLRGGSWGSYAQQCCVSDQGSNSPGSRISIYGFRVVVLP